MLYSRNRSWEHPDGLADKVVSSNHCLDKVCLAESPGSVPASPEEWKSVGMSWFWEFANISGTWASAGGRSVVLMARGDGGGFENGGFRGVDFLQGCLLAQSSVGLAW